MVRSEDAAFAAQEGSLFRGWPALLLSLCVVLAAVWSFWHRPPPAMPETAVKHDGLIVNALAHAGDTWLAAGEQGRVLVAASPEGPWTEAAVEPQRHSTLTALLALEDGAVLAVGHDGWILRSEDHGRSWRELRFNEEQSDPLLGLAGPYDGRLYAYGAFGQLLVSADQGRSWEPLALVEQGAAAPRAAAAVDDDADPFAAYMADSGSGLADRHLNGMTRGADGSLWLVGERGLIARSRDGGASWTVNDDVYAGSFFGILQLPDSGLLVYGMRGHVFRSRDGGASWTQSKVAVPVSLFGGAVDERGHVVLVGSGDVILESTDGGASFALASQKDRRGIAAVLPLPEGGWLTGGEGGIKHQRPGIGAGPESVLSTGDLP